MRKRILLCTAVLLTSVSGAFADGITPVDDAYSVLENGVLTIAAPGVLANDFASADFNPGSLRSLLDSGPSLGTLSDFSLIGSFTYTPNPEVYGVDTFKYAVLASTWSVDPIVSSTDATVTITIEQVPLPASLSFFVFGLSAIAVLSWWRRRIVRDLGASAQT
jgi:hypothetical protein